MGLGRRNRRRRGGVIVEESLILNPGVLNLKNRMILILLKIHSVATSVVII